MAIPRNVQAALAYMEEIGVGPDPSDAEAYANGTYSEDEFIQRVQRRAAPGAYSPEDIASGASGGSTMSEAARGWDGTTRADAPVINHGTDDASTYGTPRYHPTRDTEIGRVQSGEIPGWSRPEVLQDWQATQAARVDRPEGSQPPMPSLSMMTGSASANGSTTGTVAPYRPFEERFSWDPSAYRNSDAYKVTLGDMTKAIDRSAAAKGTLFTNQTREDTIQRAGDVATTYMNSDFDRSLAGYTARAGVHDANETGRFASERTILGDERDWNTNIWTRGDADRRFAAGRDDVMWGRGDTDRRFAADRSDTAWNQGRTAQNDEWGRGRDIWEMGRIDRQDEFGNNLSLSDLVLRNRPRPA